MALNFSLPEVYLSKISGKPKLFVDDHSYDKTIEIISPGEPWKFISFVGEYCPYLNKISVKEKEWLKAVENIPISEILEDLLTNLKIADNEKIVSQCKIVKRRTFLITALFDLAGWLSLENVSNILTIVADEILRILTDEIIKTGLEIRKIASPLEEKSNHIMLKNSQKNPRFFVIAMGKMGASELNYSSDIDLIFFLKSSKSHIKEQINERKEYILKARKLINVLTSLINDDFIYRTDLRLRPDPASTPIVVSTDFAQKYYQDLGRTWERMAFIKARPVAGDMFEASKFINKLENFIWRKYFDYAAIDDVKNLREKMKLNSISTSFDILSRYNIKTGLGGIRDIELFTQTYQLIVGGRQRQLRGQKTINSLKNLAQKRWLQKDQAENLIKAYRFLRNVENRLQMVNNTQTQTLPIEDSSSFLQLSVLLGFNNPELFKKTISNFLSYVKDLTDDFFMNLKFREIDNKREILRTSNHLKDLPNGNDILNSNQNTFQILDNLTELPVFRSIRALNSFKALMPELIVIIDKSSIPSHTISQFSNFLKELSSGMQLFPLLENNPSLINILLKICESSNTISKILTKDISLFGLLIAEDFLRKIHAKIETRSNLKLRLKNCTDFEFTLNELRRFVKERKFQICIHLILNKINPLQAAKYFSDTAEICIELLPSLIKKNLLNRYEATSTHFPCILGMGKLGSKEMNFYSDLDLILIYDSKAKYIFKNKNYSSIESYFARFTQALVSAFTSLTEEGRLYEVDMRLRPSGRQGPVATSLFAFDLYQKEKAWVWEHMALSRSRIISGDYSIKSKVLGVFNTVFDSNTYSTETIKKQTLKMRQSLGEKFSRKFLPPEIKFGRGGMQELELLVQMGFLLTNLKYYPNKQAPRSLIKRLCNMNFFTKFEKQELLLIHTLYFNYQQNLCIFMMGKSGEQKLSDMGLFSLLDSISNKKLFNDIKNVEDLNKVLIEKSNFIGDLFDKKLK